MMKTKSIVIMIITGIYISSCASPYIQPTSKDAAELNIKNTTTATLFINSYKNGKDCSGGEINITKNMLGTIETGETLSIKVEPNRPFSLLLDGNNGSYTCKILATFVPEPNQVYVSEYSMNNHDCRYLPGQKVNGRIIPIKSFRKRERAYTYLSTQPHCK